ncbi:MAG: hypothetical protein KKC75_08155 [Nanoarchaeota archaeon]|nr:hypothetical protein [Nanoarchaeota archaeon]MBU1946961.1 hypothetical protein [Nanoarchaeota archaeon]
MAGYFFKNWAEIIFFILLVIGFLFSLAAPSAALSYAIIFVAGMAGGRLIYSRRKDMIFPYILILVGFLIGYLIGSRYGNWQVTLVLFILGNLLSYYLHERGIIRDILLWP